MPQPTDTTGHLSSPEPIRVLMLSKACIIGPYQRKLEEIARYKDVELRVIVPPAWGSTRLERVYTTGYRLVENPIRFNGNFHLHYYLGLKRHFQSFQPHIAHIDEEPYNLATYQALRAARQAGAKTLFFSWQNLKRDYPPPFSWIEQHVLHHTDVGLVGNTEAIQVWRDKGFTGPLDVVPQFGVDPDLYTPSSNQQSRRFTIGYAGRLVPEKGLDTLINAVSQLEGDWYLVLAGTGPEQEKLSTAAGLLNIGGSVHFRGPVPSIAMPDFYRDLDVFVLPSRTRTNWKEQFGRVLIEAMSCGVPVVGAQSGAIPEVIGEAGLTFPEGSVEDLYLSLQRLLDDATLRSALSKAGRKRVLKHFTQQTIAAQTVAVYRRMMEQGMDTSLTKV